MIYELAWTRALALALGSSTYAFSAMLTSFLLGIAIGSFIFSRLSRKFDFGEASFGWLEVLIGLFCFITVPLLGNMPVVFFKIFPAVRNSYDLIIVTDFLLASVVMIIPTILMGFTFPLVGYLYSRAFRSLGKDIGDIYAINTIGCILGSFLTGFVLIPFIGVQNSLRIAIAINVLCGLAVLFQTGLRAFRYAVVPALAIASLALVAVLPTWNPAIMSSGSAVYASEL